MYLIFFKIFIKIYILIFYRSEEPENFEYDSTLDEELSESFTMYYELKFE
jgi:hypothetical protein